MIVYVECPCCGEDVEVRVTAGYPERGPSYWSAGEPADPGEVEILTGCACPAADRIIYRAEIASRP